MNHVYICFRMVFFSHKHKDEFLGLYGWREKKRERVYTNTYVCRYLLSESDSPERTRMESASHGNSTKDAFQFPKFPSSLDS